MSAPVFGKIVRMVVAAGLMGIAAPVIAKPTADRLVPAGKPVDCVQIVQIRNTEVRDDRTIDFIMSGNKVYRNTLPNSCPSLGFERRFMYKTSLSELCSVDIITVLYDSPNLSRGASCGLGKFQPMAKVK
ncbi:hypothetical protein [Sphingobium mellinum]|uniref:hypothetical protein n=1 Tax=Sphingobium mellinum TaxID=1387166 RepID=UPI003BF5575C